MEDYVEPLKEVDVKAHKDDDVNAPREDEVNSPKEVVFKEASKGKNKGNHMAGTAVVV